MSRHVDSLGRDYFDSLYAADPDPWRFASSAYEREKYAASLAALPDAVYENGLEIGCSIGIFTAALATRCRHLLAIDLAEAALARARQHCRAPNVTFENRSIPDEWPEGKFDLIVFSEVLYYLDKAARDRVVELAHGALRESGVILLVHYLGETNYPATGDAAADHFITSLNLKTLYQNRTQDYRLDVLRK